MEYGAAIGFIIPSPEYFYYHWTFPGEQQREVMQQRSCRSCHQKNGVVGHATGFLFA